MQDFGISYLLRSACCDRFGRWKPDDILAAMQETAGEHSHRLGLGRGPLLEQGAVWVLTRSEVRITRYPVYLETVQIRTFPTAPRRTLYLRFFTFTSENGELLATAGSYWAVVDIHSGAMVSLPKVNELMPRNDALPKPMGYPSAAREADASERKIQYTPRFGDFDMNGHVNNTRCAAWLCDLMGDKVLRDTPLETLIVNYNREIRGEDPVDFSWRRGAGIYSLRVSREGSYLIDVSGTLMPPGFEGGKPSPTAAP